MAKNHIKVGILLMLCLFAGQAWGATYYVAKVGGTQWKYRSGAWPDAGNGTNCTNIENCAEAINVNNTVVIEAGTYTGPSDLSSDRCVFYRSGQVIRPPQSGDTDYPAHSGTLILDGTGLTTSVVQIEGPVTLSNITIKGAVAGYYALSIIAGSNGSIFNNLILDTGSGADSRGLLVNASISATFNKLIIKDQIGRAAYLQASAGTLTFNYPILLRNGAAFDVVSGNVIVNGGNSVGSLSICFATSGNNSQVVTLNNHMIVSPSVVYGAGYAFYNASTNSNVTLNNCLVQSKALNRAAYLYEASAITKNNLVTNVGPQFVSNRRQGMITIAFDDNPVAESPRYNSFKLLAEKAEQYGFRLTWLITTVKDSEGSNITPDLWTTVSEYHSRGHEIGSHSRTHIDLTAANDETLTSEVAGSKADILSNAGIAVSTFCYPGTLNNETVRQKVFDSGYTGAIAGTSGTHLMSSLSPFNVYRPTTGAIFGMLSESPTEAEIRRRAASLASYANEVGAWIVLESHSSYYGFDYDIALDSWDYVFDEFRKSGIQVITFGQGVAAIANMAESTSGSGGELAYTRSEAHLGDASDYRLKSTSPAIDAGTAVTGLHTSGSKLITGGDAGGNTKLYGNGIDIGAFERKKFLFDDDDILPRYYTVP